ncbi:MAG: YDG domain-containing protein [Chitinispirillia bacterium]|nr:YDG domain-containing protein [Chitinispirillia bacterium]
MRKHGCWFAFVLMTAVFAGSLSAQVTVTGGSGSGEYPTLSAAFGAIGSGDYRITISENQTLAPRTIPLGQNITLASSGGDYTVQLSSAGTLFTIDMVATLRLQDGVTLRGISANNAPVIVVKQGGIFYMDGGRITGNTVSAGVIGSNRAAGVGVEGRFDMYGGEISGNTMAGSGAMGGAGGVLVLGGGQGFLMLGGTISGNTNTVINSSGNGAGGVYVTDGRFEMRGGTISGNRQTGDMARAAGGVYLANTSNFYMFGGTIEQNTSMNSSSGNANGVFVIGTSKLYLYDSPKIRDGIFTGAALASVLRVDGDLTPDAELVIQGSSVAGQMASGVNVSDQHQTLTEEMANLFVSADRKLIGTVAASRVLWAENFDMKLSISGVMDFGSAAYGYTTLQSVDIGHTITVSNAKRATRMITVSLSGAGANAFELSKTSIDNIEMDSQDEFVIKTKRDLPAGLYKATVTVEGPLHVTERFEVKFDVQKTRLTVTAASVSVVYGEPADFTARYQGFVNNETEADLGGQLTFICDYETGSAAGTYNILPAGLLSDNYNIVHAYGGILTVTPRDITVSADDITYAGKVYDGTTDVSWLAVVPLSAASGVINADAMAASYTSVAFDNKNAGDRRVTFTGLTLRGANAGNYRLTGTTVVKENVPITQRDLLLKADDKLVFTSDPPSAYTYTLTGLINGDTHNVITSGPQFTVPGFNSSVLGVYAIIPSGAAAANYNIEYQNGTLTVSQKDDVSSEIQLQDVVFVYDGTPKFPSPVFRGLSDHFTYLFIGTINNGKTYNNAAPPTEAGSYIAAVKYEDGDHIGKAMSVLTITPKPITLTGASHTKVYDGAKNSFGIRDVTFDGVIGGDIVSSGSLSAMYDSPNAGTTALTITSVRLAGADSSNYAVNVPVTVTVAGITPKPLTADMFVVAPQPYTGAELKPEPTVADGSAITFKIDGYSNNVNVGTAQVILSGIGNYGGTAAVNFTIGRAVLKVTAMSTITVYGEPAPAFKAYYSGFLSGETEASLGGNLIFSCSYAPGSNVGEYNITPAGLHSDNYVIEYANGTLTVEKRAAVINATVSGKGYDGTVSASVSATDITNRYGSDNVTAVPGSAAFVDKNAGDGKTVVFEGWSLGGSKADNYYLVRQPVAKADITPKAITINPADISYNGKIYDGTTTVSWLAVIQPTAASGVIAGDVFAASYAAASFDDKNAGARNVTFSWMTLRGADAGNYRLSNDSVTKENVTIARRNMILKANDNLVFVGDPAPVYTYTLTGLVSGETESVITAPPSFSAGPGYTGNSAPGRYTITPSGAAAANYNINYETGILTVSNKSNVSGGITLAGETFVYDGTQKSPQASYGAGSGENFEYRYVGVVGIGGTYSGLEPPVDAGNYIITAIYEDEDNIGKAMAVFAITPKPLTVSEAVHSKVYDGARNAFGVTVTLDGIVEGDAVSVSGVTSMYNGTDAGTTSLNVTYVRLAGADSANYTVTLPSEQTVAGIRPKAITAEMFTVASQSYTGSERRPAPTAKDGGNTVTFNVDGYHANINPGTAYVTVSGTGNYAGTLTLSFEIIRTSSPGGGGGGSGGGVVDGGDGNAVAQGWGIVDIADWTYNETPSEPEYSSPTNGTDHVIIEYKRRGEPDSEYTTDVPVNAGLYTIRAIFEATDFYAACSDTADFVVLKLRQDRPYIPGIVADLPGTVLYISGFQEYVPGISADLSGVKMIVGNYYIRIMPNPDIDGFESWEYSIDGGYAWQDTLEFRRLLNNTEYMILVRKRELENYYASDMEAIMVRTLVNGFMGNIGPITGSANQYGISFAKRVVSNSVEFKVAAPGGSDVNVAIYDKLGNAVFRKSGVKSDEPVKWTLNSSGRALADGSYLLVAVSKDKGGKAYRYSSMFGVRK